MKCLGVVCFGVWYVVCVCIGKWCNMRWGVYVGYMVVCCMWFAGVMLQFGCIACCSVYVLGRAWRCLGCMLCDAQWEEGYVAWCVVFGVWCAVLWYFGAWYSVV